MAAKLGKREPSAWLGYARLCLRRGELGLAEQAYAGALQLMEPRTEPMAMAASASAAAASARAGLRTSGSDVPTALGAARAWLRARSLRSSQVGAAGHGSGGDGAGGDGAWRGERGREHRLPVARAGADGRHAALTAARRRP